MAEKGGVLSCLISATVAVHVGGCITVLPLSNCCLAWARYPSHFLPSVLNWCCCCCCGSASAWRTPRNARTSLVQSGSSGLGLNGECWCVTKAVSLHARRTSEDFLRCRLTATATGVSVVDSTVFNPSQTSQHTSARISQAAQDAQIWAKGTNRRAWHYHLTISWQGGLAQIVSMRHLVRFSLTLSQSGFTEAVSQRLSHSSNFTKVVSLWLFQGCSTQVVSLSQDVSLGLFLWGCLTQALSAKQNGFTEIPFWSLRS